MRKLWFSGAALCVALASQAQGPIAWWKLDEPVGSTTAFDSVGSVNGALNGGAAFAPGGISGNNLSVPVGAASYADFGSNFGFTSGDFTASAWIKTTDTSVNNTIILGKHHTTIVAGWMLRLNLDAGGYGAVGKASFYVSQSNPAAVPVSAITVTDGQWHNIVGVFGGGVPSLYVDGVFQASGAATANLGNNADFLMGGVLDNSTNTNINAFNGNMDDAQLYNRALSAAEVTYLFNHPGSPVPEPGAIMAIGLGFAWVAWRRRRES